MVTSYRVVIFCSCHFLLTGWLQALKAVSHNYPNTMFAFWEQVSTIVYGILTVATPEVPSRPWKGHVGEPVGFIGEKVTTAAVKVECTCHVSAHPKHIQKTNIHKGSRSNSLSLCPLRKKARKDHSVSFPPL